jgi:hypothetical protein
LVLAQKVVEEFDIDLPSVKAEGSLYNKVLFADSREDSAYLGIVVKGVLKDKLLVMPKRPLAEQIKDVVEVLTDRSSGKGTILFQLRQLKFVEYAGITSDRGYFNLKASLYAQQGERYRKIKTIDTVVEFYGKTYLLFTEGSKILTSFIKNNLPKPPREKTTYSYTEVVHMDSVEKSKIMAYTIPTLKDGLYRNYKSFMNQEPDEEVVVKRKGDELISVKTDAGNGKLFTIKSKEAYAVVDKGQAFIVADNSFYPLNRVNNDFYFTGKAKVGASTSDVIMFSTTLLILGVGFTDDVSKATFDMKIDHTNGEFIRLRRVKN